MSVQPPVTGRVLVVEDDARIGSFLCELLGPLGFTVRVALTGYDALAQVDTFQPDVVLLDLTLPDITGGEVFDRLHQTHPDIAILLMTGDAERARGALARGAAGYLPKPFSVGTLKETLRRVLSQRAGRQEL